MDLCAHVASDSQMGEKCLNDFDDLFNNGNVHVTNNKIKWSVRHYVFDALLALLLQMNDIPVLSVRELWRHYLEFCWVNSNHKLHVLTQKLAPSSFAIDFRQKS